VFVLGLVLAFLLAMTEARRITGPLGILTEQILQVPRTGRISAVTITDEGEIGALASAVQKLIDYAIGKGHKLDDAAPPPADDSE
jgi:HAMP domain-containing protein